MGDINIDLREKDSEISKNYMNLLIKQSVFPLNIDTITRFSYNKNAIKSGTCIDHILFK
jgi:hypothetical protein